jgi:hypothetical protein
MSKNWKLIRKQAIWAEVLADLIQETKAALKGGSAERTAVREDLRSFIEQSPNFDDSIPIDKYDEIASRLHKQLLQADLEEELAKLENRQPSFAGILQQVRAITEDTNEAAVAISLNRVRKVVDSVAGAINSLQEIREAIDQADDPQLAKAVDELLGAFKSLQSAVEKP